MRLDAETRFVWLNKEGKTVRMQFTDICKKEKIEEMLLNQLFIHFYLSTKDPPVTLPLTNTKYFAFKNVINMSVSSLIQYV